MNNIKITIYINGKKKLVNFDCSLLDILEEFNIKSSFIAIEVNKEVVPKSKYSTKKILKGDNIEILQMIGGG
jgi:sulfur carrier protein|tara:strand:+ start:69 stop:284 length:216 start_codon:yes stop_codon:yes gene_type:complete